MPTDTKNDTKVKQIRLPNNCRYSTPSVTPKNWNTTENVKALKKDWSIRYRFFDDNLGKVKHVLIRANIFQDLLQRQGYVAGRLAAIKETLEVKGYNPITDTYSRPFTQKPGEVSPNTSFIDALKFVLSRLKKAPTTMRDLSTIIANVEVAAKTLTIDTLPISFINRKHMRNLLDMCGFRKDNVFSEDKFNRHRTYLGILFAELMEFDAVDSNIPLSIKPKKEPPSKKREIFTVEERELIKQDLQQYSPRFLLFIQIFFSSGARVTEFLKVKVQDVNLSKQYVSYEVLKGRSYSIKQRPIPDYAVELWREAIGQATSEQFVWGAKLLPGDSPTSPNAIKQRWDHVVERTGIKKSFYTFKHTNTTEIAEQLGSEAAAIQNAESVAMIQKVYDTRHQKRKDDELKKLNNPL